MRWRPAVWDKDETRKVKTEARITIRIFERRKKDLQRGDERCFIVYSIHSIILLKSFDLLNDNLLVQIYTGSAPK